MISDDNIKLAIIKAAKNKRKNNKRHRKLRYIRNHIDEYIPIVRKWILNFEPTKHKPIEINDGISAKKRFIIVPTVKEMIVHHAITNVLTPILRIGMYEHSYASIPGRGLHSGVRTTRRWIYSDHGTPVKISYWLKTPVEEAPPVPFPDIPTIKGETVIDYDGTPKPSQMYVKYKDKGAQ